MIDENISGDLRYTVFGSMGKHQDGYPIKSGVCFLDLDCILKKYKKYFREVWFEVEKDG